MAIHGVSLHAACCLLFGAALIAVSIEDVRCRLIPTRWLAFAAVSRTAALLMSAVVPGAAPSISVPAAVLSSLAGAAVLALLPAAAGAVAGRVCGRPAVGDGDVALFGVAGFFFGVYAGLAVMLAACVLALPLAGLERRRQRRAGMRPDGTFPFAPAIALACGLGMLVL